MPQRTIHSILTLLAVTLISTTIGLAQSPASTEVVAIPVGNTSSNTWEFAQLYDPTKHKLFVVTFDQPNRRQSCRIQSFTKDKLVCSRAIGGPRTYLPQQVAALILPGFDEKLRIPLWIGANVGLGASIWGTVILAATCPICAAGTAVAALVFFCAAGVLTYADGQPDRLLYLASGQELSPKLGFVEELTN